MQLCIQKLHEHIAIYLKEYKVANARVLDHLWLHFLRSYLHICMHTYMHNYVHKHMSVLLLVVFSD